MSKNVRQRKPARFLVNGTPLEHFEAYIRAAHAPEPVLPDLSDQDKQLMHPENAQLFISCSDRERDLVFDFRDRLNKSGYSCWIDTARVESGLLLAPEYEKAIAGAKAIVVCASKRTALSPHFKLIFKHACTTELPVWILWCSIPQETKFTDEIIEDMVRSHPYMLTMEAFKENVVASDSFARLSRSLVNPLPTISLPVISPRFAGRESLTPRLRPIKLIRTDQSDAEPVISHTNVVETGALNLPGSKNSTSALKKDRCAVLSPNDDRIGYLTPLDFISLRSSSSSWHPDKPDFRLNLVPIRSCSLADLPSFDEGISLADTRRSASARDTKTGEPLVSKLKGASSYRDKHTRRVSFADERQSDRATSSPLSEKSSLSPTPTHTLTPTTTTHPTPAHRLMPQTPRGIYPSPPTNTPPTSPPPTPIAPTPRVPIGLSHLNNMTTTPAQPSSSLKLKALSSSNIPKLILPPNQTSSTPVASVSTTNSKGPSSVEGHPYPHSNSKGTASVQEDGLHPGTTTAATVLSLTPRTMGSQQRNPPPGYTPRGTPTTPASPLPPLSSLSPRAPNSPDVSIGSSFKSVVSSSNDEDSGGSHYYDRPIMPPPSARSTMTPPSDHRPMVTQHRSDVSAGSPYSLVISLNDARSSNGLELELAPQSTTNQSISEAVSDQSERAVIQSSQEPSTTQSSVSSSSKSSASIKKRRSKSGQTKLKSKSAPTEMSSSSLSTMQSADDQAEEEEEEKKKSLEGALTNNTEVAIENLREALRRSKKDGLTNNSVGSSQQQEKEERSDTAAKKAASPLQPRRKEFVEKRLKSLTLNVDATTTSSVAYGAESCKTGPSTPTALVTTWKGEDFLTVVDPVVVTSGGSGSCGGAVSSADEKSDEHIFSDELSISDVPISSSPKFSTPTPSPSSETSNRSNRSYPVIAKGSLYVNPVS